MASMVVSRRAVLRLLGASASVALADACAPTPSAPSAPAAPASPTSAAAATVNPVSDASAVTAPGQAASAATASPKRGGTLRWGILSDIPNLDQPIPTNPHLARVMDPLVSLDEKLNMIPMLAESWDWSKNGTRMQLSLRKGVQWHTGRELTSADVKWNFDHFKDPKVGNGIPAAATARIESVESPDKYTVVLNSKPFSWLPTALAGLDLTDPETFQGPDSKTKVVGTGPFMWGDRVQGDHLTLVKNSHYWNGSQPYLDQITFRVLSDPQALVSQFEAGALDLADTIPLRDAVRLEKDPSSKVLYNTNGGGLWIVGTGGAREPLASNKQLRQALAYAVDRQRMLDTVLLGVGKIQELPWYPTSSAFDPSKNMTYTFDLERARSLLQAAGVQNSAFEFTYSAAVPEMAAMGQIYQSDLAKIGITLNLKPVEPVALVQAEIGHTYNLMGTSNSLSQLQPGINGSSPWYGPSPNWTGYDSPEVRTMGESIQSEMDPAKLRQLTDRWNDYVLDQAAVIGIATIVPRCVVSPQVHGMYYDMFTSLNASAAWIG